MSDSADAGKGKDHGEQQADDLADLLNKWERDGIPNMDSMKFLLMISLRGIKELLEERFKGKELPWNVWASLVSDMEGIWNMEMEDTLLEAAP